MKPCPFCERERQETQPFLGAFRVVCMELKGGCGAMGPLATNAEEAQGLWNQRGPHRCVRCKDIVNPDEDPMPFCQACWKWEQASNIDQT